MTLPDSARPRTRAVRGGLSRSGFDDQELHRFKDWLPLLAAVFHKHEALGDKVSGLPEDDVVAQTRSGKQVLNVRGDVRAQVCRPVSGDHVACVGENRKVLVFSLDELPEMGRGKGVRLQKYKDGGLSDATTFVLAEGLCWLDPAGRTRTETELAEWRGKRASSGRMAPRGFPRDNKFT